MTRFARLFLALAFALLVGWAVSAQESPGIDYDAWTDLAERAEGVVLAGRASSAALEVLREDLADWRGQFLDRQSVNEARIRTVTEQIESLGAAPEEGETEPETLANRRAELEDQLADLREPAVRADEAFTRADGLIREIDSIIRSRQASDLSVLAPSPVNPSNWLAALETVTATYQDMVAEWRSFFDSDVLRQAALTRLPVIVVLILVGCWFLARARRWSRAAQTAVTQVIGSDWSWLARTFVSALEILLPVVGALMLVAAVQAAGAPAPITDRLLQALFWAILSLVIAGWFARALFPWIPLERPFLPVADQRLSAARRALFGLGIAAAFGAIADFLVPSSGAGSEAASTIWFIPLCLAGWFCFVFGRLLVVGYVKDEPQEDEISEPRYRDRLILIFGRVLMILSILGVVAAVAGYFQAANALLPPLVETLAIFALVLVLNRVLTELYVAVTGGRDRVTESLFPVLTGLGLVLLALPVLALSWGARVADLTELWARFLEGFSLGETRISPENFLTFVIVFGVGYLLTRIIQGTLRNTILPKTRIDPGGQTAAVSGVGYLGIFLAALLAITTAGIDLSGLAIVAGALSVGIGFGLQTIVSNFVSGIILLVERPVSEGDWIEVGGVMGTVRRISVRSTRIETFDRTDVIVPNADLIASHVTNWTKTNLTGRLILNVGVAYGSDTRKVQKILQEVAEAHPMVILKPPPTIVFSSLGADSLDFEVRVILRNVNFMLSVKTDLLHAIVERFEKEGIEIPFVQRDLWLRNPEALAAPVASNDPPSETTT